MTTLPLTLNQAFTLFVTGVFSLVALLVLAVALATNDFTIIIITYPVIIFAGFFLLNFEYGWVKVRDA